MAEIALVRLVHSEWLRYEKGNVVVVVVGVVGGLYMLTLV